MSVPLYLDDDTGLRALRFQADEAGLVVVRSDDVGMRGASDEAHLRFAAKQGMVLVSCNRRDFQRLHGLWIARGETHAGIFVVNARIPAGERIRRLRFIARFAEPDESRNTLEWLKEWD